MLQLLGTNSTLGGSLSSSTSQEKLILSKVIVLIICELVGLVHLAVFETPNLFHYYFRRTASIGETLDEYGIVVDEHSVDQTCGTGPVGQAKRKAVLTFSLQARQA